VALELRPNCERCDVDLPADSMDARICTYECTFCAACVQDVLDNVCPNCGGGFERRPVRPRREWRPGLSVTLQPPSTRRRHLDYDEEQIRALVSRVRLLEPWER
jgi:hypothetical protein